MNSILFWLPTSYSNPNSIGIVLAITHLLMLNDKNLMHSTHYYIYLYKSPFLLMIHNIKFNAIILINMALILDGSPE